jgi:hypothetical protein
MNRAGTRRYCILCNDCRCDNRFLTVPQSSAAEVRAELPWTIDREAPPPRSLSVFISWTIDNDQHEIPEERVVEAATTIPTGRIRA